MGIVKVLKRKDGASLVVGVAVAFIVVNFVSGVTIHLTQKISEIGSDTKFTQPLGDWRVSYLTPIVAMILQLIVLELLIWVYVWLHSQLENAKK